MFLHRTKRKTSAQVGFVNGERLLGEEAAALGNRFPGTVYQRTRDLLGKPAEHESVQQLLKSYHLPYEMSPVPERGTVRLSSGVGLEHTAEELVVCYRWPTAIDFETLYPTSPAAHTLICAGSRVPAALTPCFRVAQWLRGDAGLRAVVHRR